jgi:hypothetical protein
VPLDDRAHDPPAALRIAQIAADPVGLRAGVADLGGTLPRFHLVEAMDHDRRAE